MFCFKVIIKAISDLVHGDIDLWSRRQYRGLMVRELLWADVALLYCCVLSLDNLLIFLWQDLINHSFDNGMSWPGMSKRGFPLLILIYFYLNSSFWSLICKFSFTIEETSLYWTVTCLLWGPPLCWAAWRLSSLWWAGRSDNGYRVTMVMWQLTLDGVNLWKDAVFLQQLCFVVSPQGYQLLTLFLNMYYFLSFSHNLPRPVLWWYIIQRSNLFSKDT